MSDNFLPGVPSEAVLARFSAAGGNEVESGKFRSPESSAFLVANAFGFFLERPGDFPPLPGLANAGWPALQVLPECQLRFPWHGGRHPWLDVVIETADTLIGIESKRYEPFRGKTKGHFADTYWQDVWGDAMTRFGAVRDAVRDGVADFARLDAAQLVKHAYGLRSAVQRAGPWHGKRPVLFYLYAEPPAWHDGRPINPAAIAAHCAEADRFAGMVAGDEVAFVACRYADVLAAWRGNPRAEVRDHAVAVEAGFRVGKA